ncbi:MAG: Glycosyl transferase group 1 [Microgenomates group bacterium GW2011_GWA2_44_7]|nr:MAG: Glycosyl transferase group 1 [Microgenomates group bacterium GW2011_GWA2_44_7]KKT77533.1 MAG: Glycosyl transferase group 1 [Microgenomates group bacterium GW2011_GWB1_44_8]
MSNKTRLPAPYVKKKPPSIGYNIFNVRPLRDPKNMLLNSENQILDGKTILIFHFRVGKTDGVSLEIGAWKQILKQQGARVLLCAGPQSIGADFTIKLFENQLEPVIYKLDEEAFGGFKKYKNEQEFTSDFVCCETTLEEEFSTVIKTANPDFILVSNVLSVGENLPAAMALARVITRKKIPTLVINHDFWWENDRYAKPSCRMVSKILQTFLPPVATHMKHCAINSLGQQALRERKGIHANILYDTFDFGLPPPPENPKIKEFLTRNGVTGGDLVILQPTRIVRRKNIELAIDFTRHLTDALNALEKNLTLYDDRIYNPQINKVVLLMAGYAEKRDRWYLKLLLRYAKRQQVPCVLINELSSWHHSQDNAFCSLLEVYRYCDLVTYPSDYEAFGNQLLEAIYSRKPVVGFEYPVFKVDHKPKGIRIISLGDKLKVDGKSKLNKLPEKVLDRAASDSIKLLADRWAYREFVQHNFKTAGKYFSFKNARMIFLGSFNALKKDNEKSPDGPTSRTSKTRATSRQPVQSRQTPKAMR